MFSLMIFWVIFLWLGFLPQLLLIRLSVIALQMLIRLTKSASRYIYHLLCRIRWHHDRWMHRAIGAAEVHGGQAKGIRRFNRS
jgi:hypothetical protein